jgi:hypothetical protein
MNTIMHGLLNHACYFEITQPNLKLKIENLKFSKIWKEMYELFKTEIFGVQQGSHGIVPIVTLGEPEGFQKYSLANLD